MSERYSCECGSNLLVRGKSRHLKTKKHQAYVEQHGKSCEICCSTQVGFFTCEQCKHEHCNTCHDRIENFKCPFCRHSWSPLEFVTITARLFALLHDDPYLHDIFEDFINEEEEYQPSYDIPDLAHILTEFY